jgi:hypothetical protein
VIRSFFFLFLVSTAFGGTPAQFAALKAQVVALQQQVIARQQNKALALAPFVTVDLNPDNHVPGPDITFHGANIHIVNGLNATQLINGLGNLIIGYDEYAPQGNTYQGYERSGSHNLVLGRYHKWFQGAFGNLMAGGSPDTANSFDGHNLPTVGQTKAQVLTVWGNPDRTRTNSDGTSAELFVPDKWKFAAPFYGMTARVHAIVVKFGPDDRVTSWQVNDQNMFSGEASLQ